MNKKIIAIVVAVVLVIAMFAFVSPAFADDVDPPETCYSTSVVYHPAEDEITKTIPEVPGFWQEFSPNKDQGPLVGEPDHPTDPRGTWSAPKFNGGPQQDTSGVFQNGNGHGSWFFRQLTVPENIIVVKEAVAAYDEIVKTEIPCEYGPVEITPVWDVQASCLTPYSDWVIVNNTDEYTANVTISKVRLYEIEFVAKDGYEFAESDKYTLSDDKGRAVVKGNFPVLRCVVPETPVDEPEIVTPEVETRCTSNKCVKITRENGVVTDKVVVKYGDDVVEEGL